MAKVMEALSNAFSQVPPPFNMVLAIVAIGSVAGLFREALKQVRTFADHEADRRLKRDLMDAGYGVDEARQLAELAVTQDDKPKQSCV